MDGNQWNSFSSLIGVDDVADGPSKSKMEFESCSDASQNDDGLPFRNRIQREEEKRKKRLALELEMKYGSNNDLRQSLPGSKYGSTSDLSCGTLSRVKPLPKALLPKDNSAAATRHPLPSAAFAGMQPMKSDYSTWLQCVDRNSSGRNQLETTRRSSYGGFSSKLTEKVVDDWTNLNEDPFSDGYVEKKSSLIKENQPQSQKEEDTYGSQRRQSMSSVKTAFPMSLEPAGKQDMQFLASPISKLSRYRFENSKESNNAGNEYLIKSSSHLSPGRSRDTTTTESSKTIVQSIDSKIRKRNSNFEVLPCKTELKTYPSSTKISSDSQKSCYPISYTTYKSRTDSDKPNLPCTSRKFGSTPNILDDVAAINRSSISSAGSKNNHRYERIQPVKENMFVRQDQQINSGNQPSSILNCSSKPSQATTTGISVGSRLRGESAGQDSHRVKSGTKMEIDDARRIVSTAISPRNRAQSVENIFSSQLIKGKSLEFANKVTPRKFDEVKFQLDIKPEHQKSTVNSGTVADDTMPVIKTNRPRLSMPQIKYDSGKRSAPPQREMKHSVLRRSYALSDSDTPRVGSLYCPILQSTSTPETTTSKEPCTEEFAHPPSIDTSARQQIGSTKSAFHSYASKGSLASLQDLDTVEPAEQRRSSFHSDSVHTEDSGLGRSENNLLDFCENIPVELCGVSNPPECANAHPYEKSDAMGINSGFPAHSREKLSNSTEQKNAELKTVMPAENSATELARVVGDPKDGTQEVEIQKKGSLGVGFCIEGGKGSPDGDKPIVVKRLFKGNCSSNTSLKIIGI